MKKMNIGKFTCIGGTLTTLAILLQSAPVFLPAIGMSFSPLSTVPIAIATFLNIYLGLAVFFSSVLILVIISVQESIILLFTTGLLGIAIGSLLYRKGMLVSILFSGIALFIGIICLTYIVGLSAFVNLSSSLSFSLTIIIFFLFSIVYSSIYNICLKKFINYLIKIKLII